MHRRRARSGMSAAEVLVAGLILCLALIPIQGLFSRSHRSVFRSRFSYMARHVARETMEELRHVPFRLLESLQHDWRPVAGHLCAYSQGGLASPVDRDDPGLVYPDAYRRIETRLTIESLPAGAKPLYANHAEADGRDRGMRKAVVEVRWQETGKAGVREQKVLARFETIIACHAF